MNDILKLSLKIYKKILNLFKYENVSDFRKEKLILNYSKLLFIISIKVFGILFVIFISILFLKFLYDSYFDFVMSVFGMIELSIFFLIYHLIRKKKHAKL